MKRLVKVSLIAIFVFAFQSCIGVYTKMSHLSEDDKEWINAYNEGDSVLFCSNHFKIDTLIVTKRKINNRINPFFIHFLDNYKGDIFYASQSYRFIIKGDGYPRDLVGDLIIVKVYENKELSYLVKFFNRDSKVWDYKYNDGLRVYVDENPIKVTDFKWNGRVFKDCIVLDDTNSEFQKWTDKTIDLIKKYVISKHFGLIYYELTNGEIFVRQDLDKLQKYFPRHIQDSDN